MEIYYGSKEEHKRRQEQDFLALSPAERVQQFIKLSAQIAAFTTRAPQPNSTNFVIDKKKTRT